MPNDYTPTDYREARAMGIDLDGGLDGHEAAVERLYNTLVGAYQRLDEECAQAHRVARTLAAERDDARWQRNVLGCALGLVAGIAGGMWWWRIWR